MGRESHGRQEQKMSQPISAKALSVQLTYHRAPNAKIAAHAVVAVN
jgi:hypothetical protein